MFKLTISLSSDSFTESFTESFIEGLNAATICNFYSLAIKPIKVGETLVFVSIKYETAVKYPDIFQNSFTAWKSVFIPKCVDKNLPKEAFLITENELFYTIRLNPSFWNEDAVVRYIL